MERRRRTAASRDVFSTQQMSMELVQDYASRIKKARESKGWTRQDLGGRVGEAESAITRIENGSLHPTDDVAKRMERELGIKLFEAAAEAKVPTKSAARGLTLGDLLRDAQQKKDE